MRTISFYELNKIKRLQVEIFEIEDDDYVDRRKTTSKYNAIERILSKYNDEEKQELRDNIRWQMEECYKKLQELGWTITTKGGNAIIGLHQDN